MVENEFLAWVLRNLPQAEIGEDNDGQLVIYTGMKIVNEEVVSFDTEVAG